jgi:CheY-like chemotaxis protein
VDDNPDVQELLTQVLTSLELSHRISSNGLEALKAVREEVPSLILLDLMMPEMNGFSFLTRLRGSAATKHVPVVVFSAAGQGATDLLRVQGVVKVMQKGNTSITELRDAIAEALAAGNRKAA